MQIINSTIYYRCNVLLENKIKYFMEKMEIIQDVQVNKTKKKNNKYILCYRKMNDNFFAVVICNNIFSFFFLWQESGIISIPSRNKSRIMLSVDWKATEYRSFVVKIVIIIIFATFHRIWPLILCHDVSDARW